jgi:hypothetical protein
MSDTRRIAASMAINRLGRDEARRIAANTASCRSCCASRETPETTTAFPGPARGIL